MVGLANHGTATKPGEYMADRSKPLQWSPFKGLTVGKMRAGINARKRITDWIADGWSERKGKHITALGETREDAIQAVKRACG